MGLAHQGPEIIEDLERGDRLGVIPAGPGLAREPRILLTFQQHHNGNLREVVRRRHFLSEVEATGASGLQINYYRGRRLGTKLRPGVARITGKRNLYFGGKPKGKLVVNRLIVGYNEYSERLGTTTFCRQID